ncbi:hypothetical protein, partial [Streptomyces sp. SP18CM02]|uniref:hypothetical protein n=1 Tax=Streptomyces sp. SP18CM02 TaxID=2758571 RepID=UPI00168B106B
QFRQLLRYRSLLATGVVIGLLGGGYLALGGEDTYTATGDRAVWQGVRAGRTVRTREEYGM